MTFVMIKMDVMVVTVVIVETSLHVSTFITILHFLMIMKASAVTVETVQCDGWDIAATAPRDLQL